MCDHITWIAVSSVVLRLCFVAVFYERFRKVSKGELVFPVTVVEKNFSILTATLSAKTMVLYI